MAWYDDDIRSGGRPIAGPYVPRPDAPSVNEGPPTAPNKNSIWDNPWADFLESEQGRRGQWGTFTKPYNTSNLRGRVISDLFKQVDQEFQDSLAGQALGGTPPNLSFNEYAQSLSGPQSIAQRIARQAGIAESRTQGRYAPSVRWLGY